MLTAYACVKQAYVRAYFERLQGIASESTNKNLVIYGLISCVFGPMIGYYDVYYNMQVHCAIVALFVIGEVMYVLTISRLLNKKKSYFSLTAQTKIGHVNLITNSIIVLGAIKLSAKVLPIPLGYYGGFLEWILFYASFYIFAILSDIMPCDNIVVPAKEETED